MKRILAILAILAFMCVPAFGATKLVQVTMQSAAAATGNGTSLNVSQVGSAGFQVTGTFVGTVTFEGNIDGTNWVSIQVEDVAGGTVSTTATAAGIYVARTAGILTVRARVSAYTSGSITVTGVGTNAPGALNVMGAGGDATAANQVLGNASLTTIAGDTTSLDGKVTACNTGAVTVSAALPTGGNAIGKLAANTGVDIGDVDVTSLPVGTQAMAAATPVTLATDDTVLGATDAAIAAAGAVGNVSAKLRRATQGLEDLKTGIVLATGANAVGKLAANTGVDIGDVDVTSLPVGTAAMAASSPVTIATDDTVLGATDTAIVAAGAVGNISAKLRRATQGLEDLKTTIVLATGGNAIGKLAANTGVDIGDVDVASSALPAGAATSAKQLADGHNVTVDNAAAAAAVNVQDGGNSLTVDGSVAVTTGEHNIVILTQAVGTPGTAEAFAGSQQVIYFFIEARRVDGVNTSNVYVGTSAVDKDASQQNVMAPGDKWEWTAPPGVTADLDAFYIDAITATDGITGFYIAAP